MPHLPRALEILVGILCLNVGLVVSYEAMCQVAKGHFISSLGLLNVLVFIVVTGMWLILRVR